MQLLGVTSNPGVIQVDHPGGQGQLPTFVQLAAELPQQSYAGLILESTFTRIADMLAYTQWARWPGLRWLVTQSFDTTAALRRVKQPVLFLHGTSDRVVPVAMQEQLMAAQPHDRARWRQASFEGASHSGASRHPEYAAVVRNFVTENKKGLAGFSDKP